MTTIAPHLPDQIEHMDTDALVPYARNSRTHSPEQVAQIAASNTGKTATLESTGQTFEQVQAQMLSKA